MIAMQEKKITLEKPVEFAGQLISEVTVREPTGGEFIKFGEPAIRVANRDGSVYAVENQQIITLYLDRCLGIDNGSHLFHLLTLKDAMEIKEALFGFFYPAAQQKTSAKDATN